MAQFQTIVLLNLSRWENPKPGKEGTGFTVDVVQEIMGGRSMGVGVGKFYFKDNGAKRILKTLNGKDLNTVWLRKAEIKELMDNPPKVQPPPAAASGSL